MCNYILGAKVILACRNLDSAKTAVEEIVEATEGKNKNVLAMKLDLSSLKSVQEFSKVFKGGIYYFKPFYTCYRVTCLMHTGI